MLRGSVAPIFSFLLCLKVCEFVILLDHFFLPKPLCIQCWIPTAYRLDWTYTAKVIPVKKCRKCCLLISWTELDWVDREIWNVILCWGLFKEGIWNLTQVDKLFAIQSMIYSVISRYLLCTFWQLQCNFIVSVSMYTILSRPTSSCIQVQGNKGVTIGNFREK